MSRIRTVLLAPLRGLALGLLAVPVFLHGVLTLQMWGPGMLAVLMCQRPPPVEAGRRLTNVWRRVIGSLSGLDIPAPYLPPPPRPMPGPDGLYRSDDHLYETDRKPWLYARLNAYGNDPATGRDLGWMLFYPLVGGPLALAPAALIAAPFLVDGPSWTFLAIPLGLAVWPVFVHLSAHWSRSRLVEIPPRTAKRKRARKQWVEHHGLRLVRLAALGGLSLLGLPLFVFSAMEFVLAFGLGMVFLLPSALSHFRWLANLRRGLARDWSGTPVAVSYRPVPEPERDADGRYRVDRQLFKSERMAWFTARWDTLWKDPASWRDLAWLGLDPFVGGSIALVPVLLVCYGGWSLTFAGLMSLFGVPHGDWYGAVNGNVPAAIPVGLALAALGIWLAPYALRLHGRWTALLLRPTRAALLARRVERLTQTRTDAVDAQAAEVRRIERDLHDGAQARLVAVGLTLGAIERLMDTDPQAARRLVAQARDTSATALAELRDLVRGIHPPVLSERGLADAVRALALDAGLPVEVHADLPARFAAPVESAAYFAVSEAVANAVRHSGASRVTVDLCHRDGVLRLTVRDDGHGGAEPFRGTGLTGVRRRLGTFDGTLALHSPPGGPTVVTMELPCEWSSPKTSTSSGTA